MEKVILLNKNEAVTISMFLRMLQKEKKKDIVKGIDPVCNMSLLGEYIKKLGE